MRKRLKTSAAVVALALALAGCGNSDDMSSITYKSQGTDKAPSVSFSTPFEVKEASTRVLQEGSGEQLKEGDAVLVNAAIYKASDGSAQGDTYSSSPISITINDDLKKELPKIYDVLKDGKVGETFAYSQPAADTDTSSTSTEGKVEIYTISQKLLKSAQGKAVTPASGLPSVTFKDGKPTITIPAGQSGNEPTTLTSQNLIDGTGQTVKKDDTVYVHYTGVRWATGKQFDSNWTSSSLQGFSLSSVVKGWTEGLTGKKVGSRVLLVVPADKAYGTAKSLGKNSQYPAGALVFVVDILGRSPAAATSSASASATATSTPAASGSSSASSSAAASASASSSQ